MPRDPRTYLWDAERATARIEQFVAGRTWADYQDDVMLRSAVERQFGIVGEALNKLRRADPTGSSKIDDLPRIVAFRNLLIHGYAVVDDRLVWEVATERIGPLRSMLAALLADAEVPTEGAP